MLYSVNSAQQIKSESVVPLEKKQVSDYNPTPSPTLTPTPSPTPTPTPHNGHLSTTVRTFPTFPRQALWRGSTVSSYILRISQRIA